MQFSSFFDRYSIYDETKLNFPKTQKNTITIGSSTELEHLLKRNDCEAIIKDRNLFLLGFCKASFLNQNAKRADDFLVNIEDKYIKLTGNEIIIKKTKEFVEELRTFFLEGFESHKDFKILIIESASCDTFLKKESSLIDFRRHHDGYNSSWYHDLIKPALPKLTEYCGATYTEAKEMKNILFFESDPPKSKEVDAIQINWQKESQYVYPIAPKTIEPQQELGKALFALYQKQEFCDFRILCNDGQFNVHSNLLYLHGGPVLKKLLISGMKEANSKEISLGEYSESTMRAFVEFLYLGEKLS